MPALKAPTTTFICAASGVVMGGLLARLAAGEISESAFVDKLRPFAEPVTKEVLAAKPAPATYKFDYAKYAKHIETAKKLHPGLVQVCADLTRGGGAMEDEEFWRRYFFNVAANVAREKKRRQQEAAAAAAAAPAPGAPGGEPADEETGDVGEDSGEEGAAGKERKKEKKKHKKKKHKKKSKKKRNSSSDADFDQLSGGSRTIEDIEAVLLTIRECFVYGLPPMTTSAGHTCMEWGLESPLWTGAVRIMAQGDQCWFRFVDAASGELFAESVKIDVPEVGRSKKMSQYLQPVIDSSRYFVTYLVKGHKRVSIGFGFRDRSSAFDLDATLQDFRRKVHRRLYPEESPMSSPFGGSPMGAPMPAPPSLADDAEAEAPAPAVDPMEPLDLGLHEGQVLRIKLKSGGGASERSSASKAAPRPPGGAAFGILPPPPPGDDDDIESQQQHVKKKKAKKEKKKSKKKKRKDSKADAEDDDDFDDASFGDFTGADTVPPDDDAGDEEWGDFQ